VLVILHIHTQAVFAGTVRNLKIAFVSPSLSLSRFSTHEQNLAAGGEKEAVAGSKRKAPESAEDGADAETAEEPEKNSEDGAEDAEEDAEEEEREEEEQEEGKEEDK
jgi:hypothetical protein